MQCHVFQYYQSHAHFKSEGGMNRLFLLLKVKSDSEFQKCFIDTTHNLKKSRASTALCLIFGIKRCDFSIYDLFVDVSLCYFQGILVD
jgi:hypothetical protein